MAYRLVFVSTKNSEIVREENVQFQYYNGFALVQKQKSIRSLHESVLRFQSNAKLLEISTKSDNPIGVMLSAFNITITDSHNNLFSLESVFQGGKIFENGGPYLDLLNKAPWEAKKDPRLKTSGKLVGFTYDGIAFPTEPKSFFYDWLYVNAVHQNNRLEDAIIRYDAFTDIEFNPNKSINCQARSAAIFVSLYSMNLLDEALQSTASFKAIVYDKHNEQQEQISMF